jgi:ATP-dependent Clp protease protease subunit
VHLCEPRSRVAGGDLEAQAEHHRRQLRQLQERVATACHRPVDAVIADMRAGRILTAQEARAYGLIDSCAGPGSRRAAGGGETRTAGPQTRPEP